MKTRLSISVLLLALLCALAVMVIAEDKPIPGADQMPPMGPPDEMKEVANMIGTWDVATKMKMDTTQTEWMEAPAVAEFSYMLDGGAIRMDYSMDMMGMPFKGVSISTYDREKKEWQETWMDNMSCRISVMTGNMVDGNRVMTGTDMWQGQELLNRQTSYNKTDTSFDWKMESSFDGGKTWYTFMTGTYTKRK